MLVENIVIFHNLFSLNDENNFLKVYEHRLFYDSMKFLENFCVYIYCIFLSVTEYWYKN